ncbi:hypothetical protein ABW19_dt0208820 [Dactylella cylindrospora]|nr:hypothetical protein ABW19_dt0208820 [Dactylella cylindrospora]
MLRTCISDAWGNSRSLPYATVALRKDVPLQRGLDEAFQRLQKSPSNDLSYGSMQEVYRTNLQNVQRALDVARRNDPDYMELVSAAELIRPGTRTGNWDQWLAVLADDFRSAGMSSSETSSTIKSIESQLARIWGSRTKQEDCYAELPLLYARISYILASNGISPSSPNLKYPSSPFATLSDYFEHIIYNKLENMLGAESPRHSQIGVSKGLDSEKTLLMILASRQTDWDSVYKLLQVSTATGMAQIGNVL